MQIWEIFLCHFKNLFSPESQNVWSHDQDPITAVATSFLIKTNGLMIDVFSFGQYILAAGFRCHNLLL